MLLPVALYPDLVTSAGVTYRASAHAERQDDGRWSGYLVFTPVTGGRSVMTARETTQSSFEALHRWAQSISVVYLEGAIERALAQRPEARFERQLADIERFEADAELLAEDLERAATVARAEAHLAAEKRVDLERSLAEVRAEAAEAEGDAALAGRTETEAASDDERATARSPIASPPKPSE